MDVKESERRYETVFLTEKDMREFKKAVQIKVAVQIFKAIINGSLMLSTEEGVCKHTVAVKDALIYLCDSLKSEQSSKFVESFRSKMECLTHFNPKEIQLYRETILKLVSAASKGYLSIISEQEEGSTK